MSIDLMKFCANDTLTYGSPNREWLKLPYRSGDKVIATNGHIMIEVATTDQTEFSDPPENIRTRVDEWFAEPIQTTFQPIPELPAYIHCRECGGNGISNFDECETCCGFGEELQRVPLGDAGFSIRYLRLLAALPNALIAPDGKNRAHYTFDGGRGILMPMRD
jgi:hypothetical protein